MKKTIIALSVASSLFITACGNSNSADTTTDMPDSGYKPRTDTTNSAPVTSSSSEGAVATDSVKNGQFNVSGIPDSAIKNKDSAGKK